MIQYNKIEGDLKMSDLASASFGKDFCDSNKCDSGNNSIFLIILLLCICGGDNGLFGGGCGSGGSCGNGGMDGILPLILILCLCGGF